MLKDIETRSLRSNFFESKQVKCEECFRQKSKQERCRYSCRVHDLKFTKVWIWLRINQKKSYIKNFWITGNLLR